MSDVTEPDDTFGENLVETMFATWVDAELKRRGGKLAREDVAKAVIELPPFGATPIVRLNDEVSLQAKAIASAPIKEARLSPQRTSADSSPSGRSTSTLTAVGLPTSS